MVDRRNENRRFKNVADLEKEAYDNYSSAFTVIDSDHRHVHDGRLFTTSGKNTNWSTGTSLSFLISPPADCTPHVKTMDLNFGRGDIDFVAYEGPTITDNGTPLTAQNVNRNSSTTPLLNLFANPTTSDNGELEFQLWVPPTSTGVGKSANGVTGVGQGGEWILAPETPWLIVLTNNSGVTIDWSYEFSWYEIGVNT